MILVPYDPQWKDWFEALRKVLSQALGISEARIHHVGSTSIPGLISKPILDIDLEIPDYGEFPKVSSSLSTLGYTDNGDQGIKDRIAFKRKDDTVPFCAPTREWINHHLYVCPSDSQELLRHIRFRDGLLRDPVARMEYARIKKEIEAESDGDRKKYALIKETRARAFVEGVLMKATV